MNKIKLLSTSNISGNYANLIQIMKMADAFSGLGSHVEIYLPGWKKNISSYVYQLRFGLKHNFKINFIPNISIRKKFGIVSFALGAFFKSKKWNDDTIVITRNERVAAFLIKAGKRIVYENHTFYFSSERVTRNYRNRVKILMKSSQVCMITISKRLKELWVDYGLDSEKIFIAHDGVNLNEFEKISKYNKDDLKTQLGLPLDKKIISYAGSLTKDRGIEFILDAASYHKDKNYFFLIMGGKSSEINHYKSLLENNNVRFIGHIFNSRIPLYLQCSDLLVMPYQSSVVTINGCSPMKVFEYLASCKFILSPEFTSFHEVMKDFEGVSFYDSKDKNKFISEIEQILSTQEQILFYNRFDKLLPYSWENRAKKIIEFYSSYFNTKMPTVNIS